MMLYIIRTSQKRQFNLITQCNLLKSNYTKIYASKFYVNTDINKTLMQFLHGKTKLFINVYSILCLLTICMNNILTYYDITTSGKKYINMK